LLESVKGELKSFYPAENYDIKGMLKDLENGSIVLSRGELYDAYNHVNIIEKSMINGQWKQAESQCVEWGYTYKAFKHYFKANNNSVQGINQSQLCEDI